MYQITINRNDINTPVDMRAIETALLSAGIDFELGERDFESSDPIEVICTDAVSAAVAVINQCGYTTDEDDILNEED